MCYFCLQKVSKILHFEHFENFHGCDVHVTERYQTTMVVPSMVDLNFL